MSLSAYSLEIFAFINSNAYTQAILEWVRLHQAWAPVIVGLLAFGESLAVISFFIPATFIIFSIGGLIGASGIEFWPVWLGLVIGGILGDWVSYVVGDYLKDRAHHTWPLSRYPDFTKRADAFMQHWGSCGVFIGRFSGPLRAFVPLAAGIFGVPQWLFQLGNVTSVLATGAADTALLHPAARHLRLIGDRRSVDMADSALDPLGHRIGAVDVLAEHRGREAVIGVVGGADRLLVVVHADQDHYRPERLLAIDAHVRRDTVEDGGLKQRPAHLAAANQPRTATGGGLD